jgi:uncharacterized protein YhdP
MSDKLSKLKNLKLEKTKPKKSTVTSIDVEETSVKGQRRHRLTFTVDHDGNTLKMSDAWVQDRSGRKQVRTMWINPESTYISKRSNLGLVMDYYNIDQIEDFVGMEIQTFPDLKNYLVVVACVVSEKDLNPVLKKEDLY